MPQEIIIGSRESTLALIQTNHIKDALTLLYPNIKFSINAMTTTGDQIQSVSLNKIGSKALFTKELEVALLQKSCHFVVHSLKDLPTTLPEGMILSTITARKDPRDSVVMSLQNKGKTLNDLKDGSVIGTSSVRRIAQLTRAYPNLKFKDIRGNLNTRFLGLIRLKKLDDAEGGYAALLLARAGVERMGWEDRISQTLDNDVMLHAVGQGALGLECREGDQEIMDLLKPLECLNTTVRCLAEREFMRALEGGCSVPLGVSTFLSERKLVLIGSVTSVDGSKQIRHEAEAALTIDYESNRKQAIELGALVAKKLKNMGAVSILEEIKANK